MATINFSASATAAVRVLQATSRDLNDTQTRIATGSKINSAADNASIWRVAQGLRSDIKSYETVSASQEYAKSVFKTAAASADAVGDVLMQMRTAVSSGLAATAGSTAETDAQNKLADLQNQLKGLLAEASTGDANLLKATGTAPSFLTSFTNGNGSVAGSFTAVDQTQDADGYIGYKAATLYGDNGASTPVAYTLLNTTITEMKSTEATATTDTKISQISTIIKNVSDYSAKLTGAANRIQSMQDFAAKVVDIRKSTLSALVDADLAEESAKLQALQVRQQLATQALSIANQVNQNILALFR